MNIFSKIFLSFTFLFYISSSSELFSMQNKRKSQLLEGKWDKPKKEPIGLWGIPFINKVSTDKITLFGRVETKEEYELCKKTKVLLGTLCLGTLVGISYYFNWFRKK